MGWVGSAGTLARWEWLALEAGGVSVIPGCDVLSRKRLHPSCLLVLFVVRIVVSYHRGHRERKVHVGDDDTPDDIRSVGSLFRRVGVILCSS